MPETKSNGNCREVQFSSDEYTLKGTLHLPVGEKPLVIIGCHGLFSTGDSPKQIALAQSCSEHGIAYFRFDHRGCGQSEGVFAEVTSLDARCRDLKNAIKTLQADSELGDLLGFFGSSFGGTVCIAVAQAVKPAALVTFATPIRSHSVLDSIDKHAASHPDMPPIDKKRLQFDISDALRDISNILIIHGDSDQLIPPTQAWEIYNKVNQPKRLIIQRNGDHQMSLPDNQKRFIREATAWFKTQAETKPQKGI